MMNFNVVAPPFTVRLLEVEVAHLAGDTPTFRLDLGDLGPA